MGTCYIHKRNYSLLSYKLNLELRSIATAIYACCYLSFEGGLQVYSKVLTGIVPGYLLGQTVKASSMKKKRTSLMRAITRSFPGHPPVGSI